MMHSCGVPKPAGRYSTLPTRALYVPPELSLSFRSEALGELVEVLPTVSPRAGLAFDFHGLFAKGAVSEVEILGGLLGGQVRRLDRRGRDVLSEPEDGRQVRVVGP